MKPEKPCIILNENDKMGDIMRFQKHEIFAMGLDTASAILPMVVQVFLRSNIFINQRPVWQSLRAMILRKDFPKHYKRQFDYYYAVTLMGEFAFIDRAMRDFPSHKFFGKSFSPPLPSWE